MGKELLVRREAAAELNEAFIWYEEHVAGLGADFLLQVDACFSKIQRSPEVYPVVHKNLRRAILRKFPYEVFFVVDDSSIAVLAVFHAKRDPRQWQSRE